ncbi:MAG: hypothetical protein MZV70_15765 [Desulfobacterales bacterium]|nr:hypothetical protein [Desulfobacterales bacterium]
MRSRGDVTSRPPFARWCSSTNDRAAGAGKSRDAVQAAERPGQAANPALVLQAARQAGGRAAGPAIEARPRRHGRVDGHRGPDPERGQLLRARPPVCTASNRCGKSIFTGQTSRHAPHRLLACASSDQSSSAVQPGHDAPTRPAPDTRRRMRGRRSGGRPGRRSGRRRTARSSRISASARAEDPAAAVVEDDDVQFVRPVGLASRSGAPGPPPRRRGPGHHVRVDRRRLARGAARQHGQHGGEIRRGRHDALEPQQRHVHARQRRRQPPVALVGDDAEAARFGDGEIDPADAHAGLQELGAEHAPRQGRHGRDVRDVRRRRRRASPGRARRRPAG